MDSDPYYIKLTRLQSLGHSASRSKAKVHREIDEIANWLLEAHCWDEDTAALARAKRDEARAENARLLTVVEVAKRWRHAIQRGDGDANAALRAAVDALAPQEPKP